MEAVQTLTTEATGRIAEIYAAQRANQRKVARTTAKERIAKLKKLEKLMVSRTADFHKALADDFGKPSAEVDLADLYPVYIEIRDAVKHLKKWMKPKKVSAPLGLLGTQSAIHFEAKGVVLIIAPWNYPINLTLGPLVSAVAAGNCAMIKPSEFTPHSSALMKEVLAEIFDENEVAFFEGDYTVSTELLKLPFNHMFFTGSPNVGKIVMRAAAEHLSSITLELGGKSPTIVDETANIREAAQKIVWGKYANNGQTCIAPDYILVHESKQAELVEQLNRYIQEAYGKNTEEQKASPDYCRVINARHQGRILSLMNDAVAAGAKITTGGNSDDETNFIAPTVLIDIPADARIMEEEIFGPILPIISWSKADDMISFINEKENPLALYIFSKNKKNIKHILQETTAGGSCINDTVIHFLHPNLPFGGSNNSGLGRSHGHAGFLAFSNERGVLKQPLAKGALQMLYPPYTPRVKKLIELTVKYF